MQKGGHVRLERPSATSGPSPTREARWRPAARCGSASHRGAPGDRARGGARADPVRAPPTGYALTPAGEDLMKSATAMEEAAAHFADAAAAQTREIAGKVRLTVDEIYAVTMLAPILRDLHEAHPGDPDRARHDRGRRNLAQARPTLRLRSSKRPDRSPAWWTRDNGQLDDLLQPQFPRRPWSAPRRREFAGHPFIGGGSPGVWQVYRAWLEPNGLTDAVAIAAQQLIRHAFRRPPVSASPSCPAWSPISIPSWSSACPPIPTMSAAYGCSPTSGFATRRAPGGARLPLRAADPAGGGRGTRL